ncbi:MAG: TIGR04100 family radical SAM protein [Clostridiales bacterium]|nr:TIGR04100 family radical SAM protein [Clostridiales bacterium]
MEILYKVYDNLYVNLTNRCPCACVFCLRQSTDCVGESASLWLEREPTAREVMAEFSKFDMSQFGEVVFCGFGEPTEAFDVMIPVARFVKETYGMPVRLNTNGLGNLINGRDITPELEGLIDTVSVSLNNPDPIRYQEIVRSRFGEESFAAMTDFTRRCVAHVPNVVMSTVDTTITHEEEAKCRKICEEIGATYRIRAFEG